MALTFSSLDTQLIGNKYRVTGLMTVSAGGGTVAPVDLGLSQLDRFRADPQGGYVPQFVPDTGVLSMLFGDYDNVADGVLIADGSAAASDIPFEAEGV